MASKEGRTAARWFRFSVAAATLLLFGTACALPALRYSHDDSDQGAANSGWRLLKDGAREASPWGGLSWAANVCVLAGTCCLLARCYRAASILGIGGLVLSPTIWIACKHVVPMTGYFLWQISVIVQGVGSLYARRVWWRPPSRVQDAARPFRLLVMCTACAFFTAACILPALYFRDGFHGAIEDVGGVTFGWEALLFGGDGACAWPWSANGSLLLGSACLLARRYRAAWILGVVGLVLSATTWLVLTNVVPLPGYFFWEASLAAHTVGSFRIWRAARKPAIPKDNPTVRSGRQTAA